MIEPTEQELQERDQRVEEELRRTLACNRELVKVYREQIATLEAATKHIEAAVKSEHWWELEVYLQREDIESLCNISPTNLLGE